MGFYHSTRSASPTFTSKEAIRRGIAPDGGLFVSDDLGGTTIAISTLANKDYPTLAREVMGAFCPITPQTRSPHAWTRHTPAPSLRAK